MVRKKLNEKILQKLIKELPNHHPQSIRNAISKISLKYGITQNAAGKEYGTRNGIKVDRWLDEDDLKSWSEIATSSVQTRIITRNKGKAPKPKKIIKFIEYDTKDRFILGHINEVNICYTYHAYTAAYILCRKIIENLLIEIIIKKYPQKKDNLDLYFDKTKNRTQDFSQILKNLRVKINDFGSEKSLLDRILNKTKIFKDEANNKTHSSYHLLRGPKELDEADVPDILDLIHRLEKSLE